MKFRIAVQKIEGKNFQHLHNIMLEAENEEEVIKKVRKVLSSEIEERERLLCEYLEERSRKTYAQRLLDDPCMEGFDWEMKGSDISKEEYLENEMWFAKNQI